jgi:tetratricopeptide (TPR) repeat protein
VLTGLESLVSKSLVRQQPQVGEASRYTMLETIREFGLDLLGTSGEASDARARHATYYLTLAERADPQLRGPDQVAWIDRLEREHDNFRAALAWTREHGQDDVGLRLAAALSWFWHLRSHLAEGSRWLDDVLARTASAAPTLTRADALYSAGVLAWLQGDRDMARVRFEDSLTVARAVDDPRSIACALGGLGMVAYMERDVVALHERMEECLPLFAEVGDEWGTAWHLTGAGLAHLGQGNVAGARARLEESVDMFRRVGDRWATAVPLRYLGQIAARQHEHDQARAIIEQCLAIFRETGDRTRMVEALTDLGGIALQQVQLVLAAERFRESLVLAQQLVDTQRIAYALGGLGVIAGAQRQTALAADLLGAADRLLDDVGVVTDPEDRVDYDRHTAALREQIGRAGMQARRPLSLDEAVAHALDLVSSTR